MWDILAHGALSPSTAVPGGLLGAPPFAFEQPATRSLE